MKSIKLLGAVLLVSSLLAVKLSAMDDASRKALIQIDNDVVKTMTAISGVALDDGDHVRKLCGMGIPINSIFNSLSRCPRVDSGRINLVEDLVTYFEDYCWMFRDMDVDWLVEVQRKDIQKLRNRLAKQEA